MIAGIPEPPTSTWEFDRNLLWRFRALPLRVIDGDTVVLLADTGFSGRHEVRVRLLGVWAAEMHQPGGKEARDRLVTVLDPAFQDIVPWPLRIVSYQKERIIAETTSFDRYVADVFIDDDGTLANVRDLLMESAS